MSVIPYKHFILTNETMINSIQLNSCDNVVTLTLESKCGTTLCYKGEQDLLKLKMDIKVYHKVAVKSIPAKQNIIKGGVVIGCAKNNIEPGEWVHLHNCSSLFDARSGDLDINSGEAKDTRYI